MAYVNGTTHYNLPQTVGTDKRDWADTNEAFSAVDAALYSATEDVADAQTEINGLKDRMTTAEGNITTNANDISALDGRLTTAEGTITQHTAQIADVRQDVEDMICAYNEASATSTHAYAIGDYFIYNDVLYKATQVIAIGDTIVPDTNCTTTNVATELLSTRSRLISEYTCTGRETNLGEALNNLGYGITLDPNKEYVVIMTSSNGTVNILNCDQVNANRNKLSITRFYITASEANFTSGGISTTGSGSTWYGCSVTSGSVTITDGATSAAVSGINFKIMERDI